MSIIRQILAIPFLLIGMGLFYLSTGILYIGERIMSDH